MDVNWVAIVVCVVVYMIIGSLWYSPILFVKPWMKLLGNKKQGNMSDLPKLLVVSFIAGLLMAYVLSVIMAAMHPASIWYGAVGGFWTWLGFIATYSLVNILYEGRPLQLFYINSGYYLVSLILMGMIIAGMR